MVLQELQANEVITSYFQVTLLSPTLCHGCDMKKFFNCSYKLYCFNKAKLPKRYQIFSIILRI